MKYKLILATQCSWKTEARCPTELDYSLVSTPGSLHLKSLGLEDPVINFQIYVISEEFPAVSWALSLSRITEFYIIPELRSHLSEEIHTMTVRERDCILLNVPTASGDTVVCALFSSYLESHKNYVMVSVCVRVCMRVCASMCERERGREGRR